MAVTRTRIANPIYDGAFKFLLDDNRIAKLFLSTIIGEKIEELIFRPTEHRADLEQRSITVFRMDFSAKIALEGGGEKLIILEVQKAKFATDIMRFRKYLGTQYASKENVYETKDGQRALPILSIYFLGHRLEGLTHPVIRVTRQYLDGTGNVLANQRTEFIESLTHDSIIIQIPFLKDRRQNDLESLLGIFDQSQKDPADAHTLSITEKDYPKKFQPVIRRLIHAISEPEVRETMEIEDTYLEDMEKLERSIAAKDEVISQKEAEIGQKEAKINQQEAEIQQKEAEIQQREAEKLVLLQAAVKALMKAGLSETEARAQLNYRSPSSDRPRGGEDRV